MRTNTLGERPTSRSDLAAWYSAALDAQARSGLSVSDYAKRIGVTGWTLYDWRRRLSGDGVREPAQLVEVTVARGPSASNGGGLVVRVGDGRRSIELPRGFDGDDLRRLVAVLESC